jgi:hypothetical protein
MHAGTMPELLDVVQQSACVEFQVAVELGTIGRPQVDPASFRQPCTRSDTMDLRTSLPGP